MRISFAGPLGHFAFWFPHLAQAMEQDRKDRFEEKTSVLRTNDTGFANVTEVGGIWIQIRGTPTIVDADMQRLI